MINFIRALRRPCFFQVAAMALLIVLALMLLANAWGGQFIIEHVERKDAAQTSHTYCPPIVGPVPAQGVPFYDITSGYPVARISDVVAAGGYPTYPKGWNGRKGSGLHNGYSHYSCANRTGEYLLAFGTNPLAILCRLSDCVALGPLRAKSGSFIGDQAEPRWSRRADESPTVIYYHPDGNSYICKQDVLIGRSSEERVYDFGSRIIQTDDNELSNDGRYGAYRLANGYSVVFDAFAGKALPGKVWASTPGLDISPDGKWFQVLDPYHPGRYFRITDLENGDTSHAVMRADLGGHGGWAVDYRGDVVSVYQCNADDWIKAFNPETGEKIKIIYMGETGWHLNQHLARMSNPAMKGWALMSSYGTTDTAWSYNQLFMLEIKPSVTSSGSSVPNAERPRIWRLGHTQGNYSGGYFSECFASVDMSGSTILWGTNWRGQDNLELYRMELPAHWHDVLDGQKVVDSPGTITLGAAFSVSWHNFADAQVKLRHVREQDGKAFNWTGAKFSTVYAPVAFVNTGNKEVVIINEGSGPALSYRMEVCGADGKWVLSDRFWIRSTQ